MIAKKQLAALFACGLIGWTVAQGLLSLLPVYAVQLGADPASTGNYLGIAFGTLTIGSILAGWLSDRFQRRKLLMIVSGVVNIPVFWLMGHATMFWQLAVLTAIAWFFIGVGFSTSTIIAGLFSGASERGKVFGILAINTSLGALIGGVVSGPIVDHWGYPALFLISALVWGATPLIALLLEDKIIVVEHPHAESQSVGNLRLGSGFFLLMLANLLAFGAGFVALLGRPLLMDLLRFSSTDISVVVAVGGAVSIPFPFIVGLLSDRIGRIGLIVLCFAAGALGLLMLAVSTSLWQFWLSSILLAGVGVTFGVFPALVTDLVPQETLGTALAIYNLSAPLGGVFGFILTGYAIQGFGLTATFIGGGVLTLAAIPLVIQARQARQPAAVTP